MNSNIAQTHNTNNYNTQSNNNPIQKFQEFLDLANEIFTQDSDLANAALRNTKLNNLKEYIIHNINDKKISDAGYTFHEIHKKILILKQP